MVEKKRPALNPHAILGSGRGTLPHAAGSGSHVPGGAAPAARSAAPGIEGAAVAPLVPATPPEAPSSIEAFLVREVGGGDPAPARAEEPGASRGIEGFLLDALGTPQPESQHDAKPPFRSVAGAGRPEAKPVSERKKLISALIDSLGVGDVATPRVSNDRKPYSESLSLPSRVHVPLAAAAGDSRQVGEMLREALADLISQCQFSATLDTYRDSIKKAYEALVEVRREAKKPGNGGLRPVTVNLTTEQNEQLVDLAGKLKIAPRRLLEGLAYQLSLLQELAD